MDPVAHGDSKPAPDAGASAAQRPPDERFRRPFQWLWLGAFAIAVVALAFAAYLGPQTPQDAKDVASTVQTIIQSVAVAAGLLWFVVTAAFAPRIQFDIDAGFTRLASQETVVEMRFVFENKGFVEHRIYHLTASMHTLEDPPKPESGIGELQFGRRLFPYGDTPWDTTLVPPRFEYHFVRPGVRQMITHIVMIPAGVAIVRITASFQYVRRGDPHTARRVFTVPRGISDQTTVSRLSA